MQCPLEYLQDNKSKNGLYLLLFTFEAVDLAYALDIFHTAEFKRNLITKVRLTREDWPVRRFVASTVNQ